VRLFLQPKHQSSTTQLDSILDQFEDFDLNNYQAQSIIKRSTLINKNNKNNYNSNTNL